MDEEKAIYLKLDEKTYTRFRVKCAVNGVTQKDAVQKLIAQWVKPKKKKIKVSIKGKGVKVEKKF